MRAISAFDHSRIAAISASAVWRSSSASPAERVWIDSTCAFASAWRRASVSSRVEFGGRLHGLRQVGHQPVRLARRGGVGRGGRRLAESPWIELRGGLGGVGLGLVHQGARFLGRGWLPGRQRSIFSAVLVGCGWLAGRVGLGPVGAPRELESRPGVGRGHASGSSVDSGRIGDVQGVAACCQPWMVWWSPLEVPAVGPGGTAAPPHAPSGAGRHRDEPGRRD